MWHYADETERLVVEVVIDVSNYQIPTTTVESGVWTFTA
ncbi:hypothetical protein Metvu_0570 [Methanocaldococcus vulcanius M7]|uniref:Uncharacterized protein n=1 Tax=Methanocaldococcus vulcanius (strain ATCC 700851 / DSM 12094 / M7) TaxID=579137 RepID=C9RFS7_METVM|nr:hypothetical protein Metvu_0570 [Methanocaldococcus vulcanius M7]